MECGGWDGDEPGEARDAKGIDSMISRSEALEAVTGARFEVVVIGGGITGAGVALDAASRGYSVALIEARDYAFGTSSRSSKMVHGGLRYLENLDLGLVREALVERRLMVELAPHLVYPTPFLVPTLSDERIDRKIGIGLNMYDVMATTRVGRGRRERRGEAGDENHWSPNRHRTIDAEEAERLVPALAGRDTRSAYLFYDCQTDDSRLVLTVLGEAERFGAVMLNGAEVVEVHEHGGRVDGVAFVEAESGERVVVEADNVVNATGVWADRLRPTGADGGEFPRISPSRGTHVTLPLEALDIGEAACIVPAGEGRTIFALPWAGRVLVGTTDNDYEGDVGHVPVPGADIEYLLEAVNALFGTSLGLSDLTGAYAGVRPLISSGDPRRSVDISRKAELYETDSGMVTITGGKLTTWRRMAEMAVDRIVRRGGRRATCVTDEIPLGMPASAEDLAPVPGVATDSLEQLAFRYGHSAARVLDIARQRPELAEPIVEGAPDLMAEVVLATRDEQARTLEDFLLRRTRLGLIAAPGLRDRGRLVAIARVMAESLSWDRGRIDREVDEWRATVRSEGLDPAVVELPG